MPCALDWGPSTHKNRAYIFCLDFCAGVSRPQEGRVATVPVVTVFARRSVGPHGPLTSHCFFWDAQTLCNTDFGRSKTKAHWFAKHAKRHTVSALVETHGTALEIDLALAELSSTHIILCNPHHDRSVGGTCVVVAKSFLRSGSGSEPEVVSTCIVPGRVQMVEILLLLSW